jgi:hypothetical protein
MIEQLFRGKYVYVTRSAVSFIKKNEDIITSACSDSLEITYTRILVTFVKDIVSFETTRPSYVRIVN